MNQELEQLGILNSGVFKILHLTVWTDGCVLKNKKRIKWNDAIAAQK